MNDKIRKALTAAREFVSGLSQYNNRVLPQAAYQEAKGVLHSIGEAQGVFEKLSPEELAKQVPKVKDECPPVSAPSTRGIFNHTDGSCARFGCCCDEALFAAGDYDLWVETRQHFVLLYGFYGFGGSHGGRQWIAKRPNGQPWSEMANYKEVSQLITRITTKAR